MSAARNRPILVTGSHRSGSTWVGSMIAQHPRIVWVNEPFHFHDDEKRSPVKRWFHHVTPAEHDAFVSYLRGPLTLRTAWWSEVREKPTLAGVVDATSRWLESLRRRWKGCRALMKDPIALFSAPWLARTFNADVVVLIRHPAAVVSSLVRLDWIFYFPYLLEQPELMRDWLAPFAEEIRRFAASPQPLLEQGILLWRIMHHVIFRYQQEHPEWIFLRHEDLSMAPEEEFERLLSRLGLEMTEPMRHFIRTHSSSENPEEATTGVAHELKRDSRANVWNWLRRLAPEQVARIRKGTEDVAQHFYSDADWHPAPEADRKGA